MTKLEGRRVTRRKLLKGAGALGLAASATVLGTRIVAPAIAGPAPKVRIAWTEVAACHSPLGFGVAKGFYAKQNVDVELFYQGASGQTLIQALATNKADVGAGLILDWLKPLEQGFDVKLFVGSHGGCQRLLASSASGVTDLAGVKGKRIVSYGPGSPPKVSFAVTWVTAPFELVGDFVNKGEADLAAHLDPWAWQIEKKFNLKQVADTQTGIYDGRVCCVLGANGPFLAANKDAVRRVAAANLEIHEYTATHPEEVAQWYADNLKPAGLSAADLTEILRPLVFHNHPVGKTLVDQVEASIADLKLVKVIDPATDPKELANRVTVDILA
jgi:NitT/TauT family transport system substrate-binding protein